MTYPGGKAGVYQTLINLMPPHLQYIEPFLGMGGVMRHKRPAGHSIGIDSDVFVVAEWQNHSVPGLIVECGDGIRFLRRFNRLHSQTLVYCDPPYLPETCKSRVRYRHGLSKEEHLKLLTLLRQLNCMVMISGYPNTMYDDVLNWRRYQFTAMTRGGILATEVVWMNFPPPKELHDYRFLGTNFREREVIRRRIHRWKHRFTRMNELERFAMFAALGEVQSLNARNGEPRGSLELAMTAGAGGTAKNSDVAGAGPIDSFSDEGSPLAESGDGRRQQSARADIAEIETMEASDENRRSLHSCVKG